MFKYRSLKHFMYTKLLGTVFTQLRMKYVNKSIPDKDLYIIFNSLLKEDEPLYHVNGSHEFPEYKNKAKQYLISLYHKILSNEVPILINNNKSFRKALLDTGNQKLVYISNDTILGTSNIRRGLNLWGEYLMKYRDILLSERALYEYYDAPSQELKQLYNKFDSIKNWFTEEVKLTIYALRVFFKYLQTSRPGFFIPEFNNTTNYLSDDIINYVLNDILTNKTPEQIYIKLPALTNLINNELRQVIGDLEVLSRRKAKKDKGTYRLSPNANKLIYNNILNKFMFILGSIREEKAINQIDNESFDKFIQGSTHCVIPYITKIPGNNQYEFKYVNNCAVQAYRYIMTTLMDWLGTSDVTVDDIYYTITLIMPRLENKTKKMLASSDNFDLSNIEEGDESDFLITLFKEYDINLIDEKYTGINVYREENREELKNMNIVDLLTTKWQSKSFSAKQKDIYRNRATKMSRQIHISIDLYKSKNKNTDEIKEELKKTYPGRR